MKYVAAFIVCAVVLAIGAIVTEIRHERRFPWVSIKVIAAVSFLCWCAWVIIGSL